MSDLSGGVWRTINGARVYIKGGQVVAGPPALMGSRVGSSVTCATPFDEVERKAAEAGGIDGADWSPWGNAESDNVVAQGSAYATGSEFRPTDKGLEVHEVEMSEADAVDAVRARDYAVERLAESDIDEFVRGVVLPGEMVDRMIDNGVMTLTGASSFGASEALAEEMVENWSSSIVDPVTVLVRLPRSKQADGKAAMWVSKDEANADFDDTPDDYPYEVLFGGNTGEVTRVQRGRNFDFEITIRLPDSPTEGRRRIDNHPDPNIDHVWADPGKQFHWEK